jgi:hypothetical protein
MAKKTFDLAKLNSKACEYFYQGYDIFFIHGWFSAYLSAPSDSEEDDVIPTYMILNEDKIADEKLFTKFIDELMLMFSDIADSIYEKNKSLKPLINLGSPNNFTPDSLTDDEKRNLLVWLYGYLSGFIVIGSDITEYCKDDKTLDEVFFPALSIVCSAFLLLDKEVNPKKLFTGQALDDYYDLCLDIEDMWERDENDKTLAESLHGVEYIVPVAELSNALSAIFFVVRTADESRINAQAVNPLLKNLSIH